MLKDDALIGQKKLLQNFVDMLLLNNGLTPEEQSLGADAFMFDLVQAVKVLRHDDSIRYRCGWTAY